MGSERAIHRRIERRARGKGGRGKMGDMVLYILLLLIGEERSYPFRSSQTKSRWHQLLL